MGLYYIEYLLIFCFEILGAPLGLLGASKAAIADVSDNTNQAKGMAYVTAAWGMGLVAGQALGGLLAEPVRQYPGVFPRGETEREMEQLLRFLLRVP